MMNTDSKTTDSILDVFNSRNDINEILTQANFIRLESCCGIDDKYCSTDIWRGNVEGLVKMAFREGIRYANSESQKTRPNNG